MPASVNPRLASEWSGSARNVETTTAAQTRMNAAVVIGCPGIANVPRTPRCRKTKTQEAVKAKKTKSIETT